MDDRAAASPLRRARRADLAQRPAGAARAGRRRRRPLGARPAAVPAGDGRDRRTGARRTGAWRRRRRRDWAAAVYPDVDRTRPTTGSGVRSPTSAGSTPTIPSPPGPSAWRRSSAARAALTDRRFDAIHLHGPGTDLTVGLLRVVDGGMRPSSRRSTASPTTRTSRARRRSRLPIRSGSTATSRATMPLELYGSVIRGLRVEFEDGTGVADRRRRERRDAPLGVREGRRRNAPRRARARRRRRADRPAADGLLRHAARRERGKPHRARLRPTHWRSRTTPTSSASTRARSTSTS